MQTSYYGVHSPEFLRPAVNGPTRMYRGRDSDDNDGRHEYDFMTNRRETPMPLARRNKRVPAGKTEKNTSFKKKKTLRNGILLFFDLRNADVR